MKINKLILAVSISAGSMASATAQELLNGDTRSACEAIICLSTGSRPSECSASLARYFGISFRNFSDTIKARANFLNLCPVAKTDRKMQTLVNDIANGAGRCDAATLNSGYLFNLENGISDTLPSYCANYARNAYTDVKTAIPIYVGTPALDGFWVEASEYPKAIKDYNARKALAEQDYGASSQSGG